MKEQNGGYSSWITNNDITEKLDFKEEKLDQKIIQQHIDLFEKHHKILGAYKKIIEKVLLFGNDVGRTDFISFQIEIRNPNKLTVEIIKIDDQIIEPTTELITHFLNNIYLNKDYLPMLYHDNNEKEINKKIQLKLTNKRGNRYE